MDDVLLAVVMTELEDAEDLACEGTMVCADIVLSVDTGLSSRPGVTVGVEAGDGSRGNDAFGVA